MKYVKWADGIDVSEEDAELLAQDERFFGTAYVMTIGHGRGRRIDPLDIKIRTSEQKAAD